MSSNAIVFDRKPLTPGKPWPGALAAPVDPLETTLCARAQSLLTGGEMGVCPPLKPHQARDVLAWAGFAI